ncbi:MAG: helix-turn-helix domain-containing protein [Marinobacterium sp.]|nr:helix-turn-helix domain-containing protein [Marinobacterium sp.]
MTHPDDNTLAQPIAIGRLSALTDCKIPTIRYYEEIGLLPPAARNAGNQRRYNQQHLLKLRFIRHARALGFDLEAIRELLQYNDAPDHHCHDADQIARRHLQAVKRKIARLESLREELERMLSECHQLNQHPEGENHCRILEVLADHALCATEHGQPDGIAATDAAARGR